MGNGAIAGLSEDQVAALRAKFEEEKLTKTSDAEVFNHMKNYIRTDIAQVHSNPNDSCQLRIIAINDVYEIDMLPHYSTCRKLEEEFGIGATTIGVLPGDFVAPSFLSSLNKGSGMVDCMNASKVDFVCIGNIIFLCIFYSCHNSIMTGNHEADIPLAQLHNRIKQSTFTWINSNMPGLPLAADMQKLPEYSVVEIRGEHRTRRVALLGLNTEDPSILRKGAFGDCAIEPLIPKALELYKHIMETETGIDLIIPLTHQVVGKDRELAQTGIFPIIIGGHDHDVYLEEVNGCTIVKTGQNGNKIGVCYITWPDATSTKPTITVTMKEASSYPPDPEVTKIVEYNKALLHELEMSKLCDVPPGVTLSSKGIRLRQTTIGSFLCSALRDALETDIAILNAGCIRANHDYTGEKVRTLHLYSIFFE